MCPEWLNQMCPIRMFGSARILAQMKPVMKLVAYFLARSKAVLDPNA